MNYYPTYGVSDRKILIALLLWFFLGVLGVHRFYVGKIGTGLLNEGLGISARKGPHLERIFSVSAPSFSSSLVKDDNNCNNQSVTSSTNLFGIDIDPQLVISPVPHFAFTAGPAIDIGLAGGASSSRPGGNCNTTITTSEGYSSYNIGITGGLLGWF